jgi:hypothetical protein
MTPAGASDLREKFERDGFVIVKSVLEPERCAEMIEQIWVRLPDRFRRDEPETWTGRIEDCCNNLPPYQRNGLLRYKDKHGFKQEPVFERHIYSNPRFAEIFRSVTGRLLGRLHIRGLHPVLPMPRWVSVNEATGNRLDPQMDSPERAWPKIPRPPQLPILGHLDAHPIDVLMIIYLDEVPLRGGGLAVWPGSHRLLRLCFESLYDFLPTRGYRRAMRFLQRFRPLDLAAGQGDVILFDSRLLHSNSINESQRIRQALLVDSFADDWRRRDAHWKQDERAAGDRLAAASTDDIAALPAAKQLAAQLKVDFARAFWSRHTRLRGWISEIAKDPSGKARRQLSAKIRSRREGDCWIVVSQDSTHRSSHKLDAYGVGSLGSFDMSVNGAATAKSLSGAIVERIDLKDGKNSIDIQGKFAAEHYVRIIRSRNPFDKSDILYEGTIEASSHGAAHRITIEPTAAAR